MVAVIDSGIARTAELSPVLVAEYDEAVAPGRATFSPRHSHGTIVASILNRAAGGAVDIISFRIDDEAGCPAGSVPPCQADPLPVARAIDHATALGVDAINLSLTLANHPAIVGAVSRATRQGIIVVMAAGNKAKDRPDNVTMARAGFPLAVLVGATGDDDRPWPLSNRPEAPKPGYNYVWRRGVGVPATDATGAAVRATGTSFAAPVETARRVLAPVMADAR